MSTGKRRAVDASSGSRSRPLSSRPPPLPAPSRSGGISVAMLLNSDPSDQPNSSQDVNTSTTSSDPVIQDEFTWDEGVLGGVETSVEEASGPDVMPPEYECPLCGAFFQSARNHFQKHLRDCHTTILVKGEGTSNNNPKAIHSCGYCCAAFTDSSKWTTHVSKCKAPQGWIVVNQVLGIIRRMLSGASEQGITKIQALAANFDPASTSEPTIFKEDLTKMEAAFPMSEELFDTVAGHLQINQICAHQIMNGAYVVSPDSTLCASCYPPDIHSANAPRQRGLVTLTTSAPSEEALKRSKAKQAWDCPVCELKFNSCEQRNLHVYHKHPDYRYQCPCTGCPASYTTIDTLNKHMMIHGKDSEKVTCPVEGCDLFGVALAHRASWNRHMKRKHPDVVRNPLAK